MHTYTPMIQQYLQVKAQYEDAFLFFRLGDFYEMFFQDAIDAASILEITLTSRDGGAEEKIPMCGVPYHSAEGYIETLVQKGYKVAICEQVEDPQSAKGIVKREVVRIITPGTLTEGKTVDAHTPHFIGAVEQIDDKRYGFAYVDFATGEGKAEEITGDERSLIAEIEALGIREIVVNETFYSTYHTQIEKRQIVLSVETAQDVDSPADLYYQVREEAIPACRRLVAYLTRMRKMALHHLQPFQFIEKNAKLSIDAHSMRNLELVQSIRQGGKEGTLYGLLDDTITAMGARLLKMWIHQPLANEQSIQQRLAVVSAMIDDYFTRDELRNQLKEVYDLERLSGKIAMGSATGRDLAQLRNSLRSLPSLKTSFAQSSEPVLQQMAEQIDLCEETHTLLEEAIAEHPPLSLKEGGIIKEGYHQQLDQFRDASKNGKEWLMDLERQERERTGIKSLKIGYNRVFGYYIEITKANLQHADLSRYERKQTLTNAERFITPELKEKEALILNAEEQSMQLEYELFTELRETLKHHIRRVQLVAARLAEIDVLLSFATVSERYQYVKPEFHSGRALVIENGRHPVVEKMMDHALYTPNSCHLSEEANMLLITGPNMSGKSTYMRQIALTVIMAQMGCYVPCDAARLPITDQIFTRIGAADDLASGQSTFMVEMMESQHAITHATPHSLLLFDEIGRGTSTYDGMALAQAMMEYIHDYIGANTLFSTHYHELTTLDQQLPRLKNVHVAAKEQDGKVIFLHKVMPGAADKSYGIHVAELAGLPEPVVQRAKALLEELEQGNVNEVKNEVKVVKEEQQLSLFDQQMNEGEEMHHPIVTALRQLDIVHMSPMDAFMKIVEWKKQFDQQ